MFSQFNENDSDEHEFTSGNSRLARNRRTARLRRERKKQEAERLTSMRLEAISKQQELRAKVCALDSDLRSDFEKLRKKDSLAGISSGCLFCNQTFLINNSLTSPSLTTEDHDSEIVRHYLNDHPHDVKSNQAYLGEDFVLLANSPKTLLSHVLKLSQENKTCVTVSNSDTEDTETATQEVICVPVSNSNANRRLSVEEKRKRRLERNAESARLCRQRKKLYIQRIRLELPEILRENSLMSEFLQKNKNLLTDEDNLKHLEILKNRSEIPKMTGWDVNAANPIVGVKLKSKRNLSYGNLSDLGNQKSAALPILDMNNLASLIELNNTFNNLVLASALQNLNAIQQTSISSPTSNNIQTSMANNLLNNFNLNHNNLDLLNFRKMNMNITQPNGNGGGSKEIVDAAFALTNLAKQV